VLFKDEYDVAKQVVGFMQQFLEVFSELKGKKLYLTGESVGISLNLNLNLAPEVAFY